MQRTNQQSFAGGLVCGAALAIAASVLIGHATAQDRQPPREAVGQYFVTGDIRNGTLWRLESDGTLACVSRSRCDEPFYPPEDQRERRRREPSVPMGPRVPTGPSVPLDD